MMNNEYLSAKEVAAALGVCTETARKLIKSNMVYMQLGRNELRVSRAEVDSYIEREQKKPNGGKNK